MSMLNVVIIHFLDLLSVKCEVLNQESILRLSSFAVVSYFQSGSVTSPFIFLSVLHHVFKTLESVDTRG